ncbi:MAG: methionyl-tRNA formyltransferase [Thermoanaerobaculia bacterium]
MKPLIFFGTPEFALPTLEALCRVGREPVRVVTQPARPVGRGRRLQDPPVALWAREQKLEAVQPEGVREPEFIATLASLEPAVAIVVAFGQIFPRELLELPTHGCINLHASLLPRYRGAAPIQAAIAAGDKTTGVTTMRMEEGLDTGPILLQEETEIGPQETGGELSSRLSIQGAELVLETLDQLEAGRLDARAQTDEKASSAPRLKKADGEIDWSLSATHIFNRLRAFTPWPGVFSHLRGQPVKILWGEPVRPAADSTTHVSELVGLVEGRLIVCCGEGTAFAIERLQRPGRKSVTARELDNGEHLEPGERFE